ncbi:hypothetical protein ES705_40237 [subsurface metagenome]
MKKLLLVSLICLLVFSFATTAVAKVTLNYWIYPIFTSPEKEAGWFEKRVIAEFQEIYPEVEFELQFLPWTSGPQKVAMSIATGTPPDLIVDAYMRGMSYAAAGVLSDYEDTMDAEEKADYYQSVLDMVKIDGKIYMYVLSAHGKGMPINRLVAEKAGAMDLLPLDRDDRDWTVEEYKKFCLKIAEAKIPDTYAMTLHFADSNTQQEYIFYIHQNFGAVPFVIEDGKYRCTLNSPEAIEGLEWYLDLYSIPGVGIPGPESLTCDWIPDYWFTGRLASHLAGATATSILKERKDPKISKFVDNIVVNTPHKKGLKSKGYTIPVGFCVFKTTPEREKYAKLFAEFFVTRPYLWVETSGYACPPRRGSFDPDSPLYQTNPYPPNDTEINFVLNWAKYMEIVDIGGQCPVNRQYREIYAATMQGVFTGELTPKEGLDIVVKRVNKLLDDYYEENPVE